MEMQALTEGVLRKIIINEGECAPLAQLIAIIGSADEDISSLESKTGKDSQKAAPKVAEAAPAAAPGDSVAPPSPPAATQTAPANVGNGRQGQVTASAPSGRLVVS